VFTLLYRSGTLISDTQQNNIKTWLPNKTLTLLYKVSQYVAPSLFHFCSHHHFRDGFAVADFHKHCDDKGPTLTIIRSSQGFLFGGYSPVPWDVSGTHKTHPDCFIFTLTNPHSIPPTKYQLNPGNSGIYCDQSYHATFGGGNDITVRLSIASSHRSVRKRERRKERERERERERKRERERPTDQPNQPNNQPTSTVIGFYLLFLLIFFVILFHYFMILYFILWMNRIDFNFIGGKIVCISECCISFSCCVIVGKWKVCVACVVLV
jgi:TLD